MTSGPIRERLPNDTRVRRCLFRRRGVPPDLPLSPGLLASAAEPLHWSSLNRLKPSKNNGNAPNRLPEAPLRSQETPLSPLASLEVRQSAAPPLGAPAAYKTRFYLVKGTLRGRQKLPFPRMSILSRQNSRFFTKNVVSLAA